jgi:hypothetical protein
MNDNEMAEDDFERRGRMIQIAHRLVAMTCLDDGELNQEVGRLTKGFNGKEVADIVRFAAVVARAQAQQFESLSVFTAFYGRSVNQETSQ